MRKNGAKWTKKYPVIDLYDFHPRMKSSDENRITREMMRKFGVANVRGGSWTKVNMTKDEIRRLESKLKHKPSVSTKSCTRCGRDSHTKAKCYARTHKNGSRLRSKTTISRDSYAKLLRQQELAKRAQIEANITRMLAEVENEPERRVRATTVALQGLIGAHRELRQSVLDQIWNDLIVLELEQELAERLDEWAGHLLRHHWQDVHCFLRQQWQVQKVAPHDTWIRQKSDVASPILPSTQPSNEHCHVSLC